MNRGSGATARFDPNTGLIAVLLDQPMARDLVDAMALNFTGPKEVRQELMRALGEAREHTEAENAPQERAEPSPTKARPLLTVAVDGGASPNPGPSGWAWVDEHGEFHAGSIVSATNNIAELTALENVLLDHEHHDLMVVYDSQYAVRCVTEWGPVWRAKSQTGKKNAEQVYRIMDLLALREAGGLITQFSWVKGHSGHPLNEAADKLCTQMIKLNDGEDLRGDTDIR